MKLFNLKLKNKLDNLMGFFFFRYLVIVSVCKIVIEFLKFF